MVAIVNELFLGGRLFLMRATSGAAIAEASWLLRPRLPPAPAPPPSAAADTNQLESALPRPVPGPPLVSPPPPAGGVPAADRRRPQPASEIGRAHV